LTRSDHSHRGGALQRGCLLLVGALALGLLPGCERASTFDAPLCRERAQVTNHPDTVRAGSAVYGAPPVDARHIFCGEINASGEATGFHARPEGRMPRTVAKSHRTRARAVDALPGVVQLRDFLVLDPSGASARKDLSTLFPDACSAEEVIGAIQSAYLNARAGGTTRQVRPGTVEWRGTGDGAYCTDDEGAPLPLTGYLVRENGGPVIRTAWPDRP